MPNNKITRIKIYILESFYYSLKYYRKGKILHKDIKDPKQKSELLLFLSNDFPHKDKISLAYYDEM